MSEMFMYVGLGACAGIVGLIVTTLLALGVAEYAWRKEIKEDQG